MTMINTIQDCEHTMLKFELLGEVYFDAEKFILCFDVLKPKFKLYQFISKRNFAHRYMLFMNFINENMTLGTVKEFNLSEV